jgi:IclR family pca regulon transcriptional regulator
MERHPLTPRTVHDIEGVLQQVAQARERGYALNDGELELGVRSMAVPVFNRDGQAIAAMSIAIQADRNSISEMTEAFLPPLLRAQGKLAERLYGG